MHSIINTIKGIDSLSHKRIRKLGRQSNLPLENICNERTDGKMLIYRSAANRDKLYTINHSKSSIKFRNFVVVVRTKTYRV